MIKHVKDISTMTIGAIIAAFGVSAFLIPNKLVSGGVTAISTILHHLTQVPTGTYIMIINIPIFILGFWKIGKGFGLRTLFSVGVMSIFISIFERMPLVTDDMFIAAVFGGLISGFGMGLVFVAGSTTGGTDIVARFIRMLFKHVSIGRIILVVDIIIIGVAVLVFNNLKIGLYSAIALYLSTKTIDSVLEGLDFAKMVYIVSDCHKEIAKRLSETLERGTTGFYAKGMYTGEEKVVLMCVVRVHELPALKMIVQEIDTDAFVVLSDAREVLGEGFKVGEIM